METLELRTGAGSLRDRVGDEPSRNATLARPKKKRKKALPPRTKRMKRPARLQSAPHWIPKYPGKNLVRGYARRYGVDLLCAAGELRMLGVEVDPAYVARLEATVAAKAKATPKRKEEARAADELESWGEDCDDTFAYIAGYTSGGVPYGTTWEELGERPPWWEDEEDGLGVEL